MPDNQEKIFAESEGDSWFERNYAPAAEKSPEEDGVIQLLDLLGYQPKKVLEVGCTYGWRLDMIRERYNSSVAGVDVSQKAIEEGQKKFPEVSLHVGTARDLSQWEAGAFDCVVIYGVFLWIDRSLLLQVVAELDRVLADNGLLIIGDFYPDHPRRVDYHHVDDEVYTYKQNYAAMFTATNLYTEVGLLPHHLNTKQVESHTDYYDRYGVWALRKDLHGRYLG